MCLHACTSFGGSLDALGSSALPWCAHAAPLPASSAADPPSQQLNCSRLCACRYEGRISGFSPKDGCVPPSQPGAGAACMHMQALLGVMGSRAVVPLAVTCTLRMF